MRLALATKRVAGTAQEQAVEAASRCRLCRNGIQRMTRSGADEGPCRNQNRDDPKPLKIF